MNPTAKKYIIDQKYANIVSENSIYFGWIKYFRDMSITEIATSFFDVFNERLSNIEQILNENPEIKGIHLRYDYVTNGGSIYYYATKEIRSHDFLEGYFNNEIFELTNSINEFRLGQNSNFRFGDPFFCLIGEGDTMTFRDYGKICEYLEKLGHLGLEEGFDMFVKTKKLPKGFSFFKQDVYYSEAELFYMVK